MASVQNASINGVWGGAPSGVQGLCQGVRAKLKAFCPFSYKKGPKVKDLNENSSPCLRQTASCSYDQP